MHRWREKNVTITSSTSWSLVRLWASRTSAVLISSLSVPRSPTITSPPPPPATTTASKHPPGRIVSLHHPLLRHWLRLVHERRYRSATGRCVLSGAKLIAEVASKHTLTSLICHRKPCSFSLFPSQNQKANNQTNKNNKGAPTCTSTTVSSPSNNPPPPPPPLLLRHHTVYYVTPRLLTRLATRKSFFDGVCAELPFPAPSDSLADARLVVCLSPSLSAATAGTLLRSALALQWQVAWFPGGAVDAFDPALLRASQGALFFLPYVNRGDTGWQEMRKFANKRKLVMVRIGGGGGGGKGGKAAVAEDAKPPRVGGGGGGAVSSSSLRRSIEELKPKFEKSRGAMLVIVEDAEEEEEDQGRRTVKQEEDEGGGGGGKQGFGFGSIELDLCVSPPIFPPTTTGLAGGGGMVPVAVRASIAMEEIKRRFFPQIARSMFVHSPEH
eukprot:GHVS01035898.1.p1 GENE.GHVS01035898.1~~GHVS01035898.1.p1  ORF type:complete len:440 (+),score=157.50 GHVS01035898.1:77-1396(+)